MMVKKIPKSEENKRLKVEMDKSSYTSVFGLPAIQAGRYAGMMRCRHYGM